MRCLRVAYALFAALVLLCLIPVPAQALPLVDDCKDAPAAAAPGTGVSGWFSPTPDELPTDPPGGAWVDGAPSFAHYGTSGMSFRTYDLGCGPDFARNPDAVVGTMVANWILEGVKFTTSAAHGLLDAAYHPTFLSALDPMLVEVTDVLRSSIFDEWVPVALAVAGLMLLWVAHRGALAHTVVVITWALFVMVLASTVFSWPVKSGSFADETVGDTVGAVHGGINGTNGDPVDSAMQSVSNAVLWEQWKMGTFGRAHSATADKYAKDIYTGQALTYAEAATVAKDPDGAGKELLEAKAEQWENAAEAIEEEDPDAYAHLTGKRPETRFAAAALSGFSTLCVIPFLIAGPLLMLASFLVIRLAVMFAPLIATLGVVWSLRGAVKGALMVVGAAVLNCVMFGVGTAVTILAVKTLMDPDIGIPLWLSVVLMALVSFIMWVALKPARRLTAMASPSRMFSDAAGAVGSAAESAKSTTVGAAKAAAAAYTGNLAALRTHGAATDGDDTAPRVEGTEERDPKPYRMTSGTAPEEPTAPQALPAGHDRAPALDPVAAPVPPALPPGTSPPVPATPDTAVRAAPVAAEERDVFVPGTPESPEQTLPVVAEPFTDDGETVYPLFVPETDDADTRP